MNLLKNRYIGYAVSIVLGRGSEYLVFFLGVSLLSKEQYGVFDFYKRFAELAAILISAGGATFMLTYPKTKSAKSSFLLLTSLTSIVIGILSFPVFWYFNYAALCIPAIAIALFSYSNSTSQSFFLVRHGSKYGAAYKSIVAVFVLIVSSATLYYLETPYAYMISLYGLFFMGVVWLLYISNNVRKHMVLADFIRYLKLYRKVFFGSILILINTIVGFAFMYSDIFIIKLFSSPETEASLIADFGFCLTIANMVLLIPTSLVQVDIEKMKKQSFRLSPFIVKSHKLLLLSTVVTFGFGVLLTQTIYDEYAHLLLLFTIILFGKYFQGASVPIGTYNLIKKYYMTNFYINIFILGTNVIAGVLIFPKFGSLGVALLSSSLLFVRYTYFHIVYHRTKSIVNVD